MRQRQVWTVRSWVGSGLLAAGLLAATGTAPTARAEVPYPVCALPACDPACAPGDDGCIGADDYADYLFLEPGERPDDYQFDPQDPGGGSGYVFEGVQDGGPAAGVRIGHDIVGGWEITTGRPDVVVAILDSGIEWDAADLRLKVALNTGELPLPAGCPVSYDCDANGVVNVDDFQGLTCGVPGTPVHDDNGNGALDAQDLIALCSDGLDGDLNGYVDDIAGWDFQDDDNDPSDDVRYGHGTGEGRDQVSEANDGSRQPGVAPASMFVPLKVADSFVAVGSDFSQAVVYAVDLGVDLVSEALGTISAEPSSQQAIDYAYRRGIPLIASAADEQSLHHNLPAALEHTIWVNSVRPADGDILAESPPEFTLLNGCTNHGGHAWIAMASKACSSEATGRAGGLTSLLIAQGKNLLDHGELTPYPGLEAPFSAEEVRQLLRQAAVDIDQSGDPPPALTPLAGLFFTGVLSDAGQGFVFAVQRFATQAGWDQYTGWGRPDAPTLLSVTSDTIPPEADLSGSLRWFDIVDPIATPTFPVVGSAAAVRVAGLFDWSLSVGCGVQPSVWTQLDGGASMLPLVDFAFHDWDVGATASACDLDPDDPFEAPDQRTVTLRLRVTDDLGNVGEDRRTVAIHRDADLAFPALLGDASIEASPVLADVDGDEVLDVVIGTSAGTLHVLRGSDGTPLPGFPVRTDPIAVHPSPAYASEEVEVPREGILSAAAVGDLDRDDTPEIVVATTEGSVYVFEHDGALRPGFPVATDPALSDPALRDRFNDLDPGISGAPTLADLDAPGGDGSLEIVAGAWDGHVYAWRHDGGAVAGFPAKLADAARVDVDPVSGRVTPASDGVRERLAKIVGSPAVGDLDGDGSLEIVAATNEEYRGDEQVFDADSGVFASIELAVSQGVLDALELQTSGRIYALHGDGSLVEELGGQPAAWPAVVPLLVSGLLPSVATGTPGSPALADVDGEPGLEIAIFGSVGPVILLDGLGTPLLPEHEGSPGGLAIDFPRVDDQAGFPAVPATAGSADAPFFPALGSGAFGDLDGDQQPEYAAPTAGVRVLFDAQLAASQEYSDHQLTAWDPRTGAVLPAWPRVVDDLQFLTAPALGDVSGDGVADVVNGSGAYLVRAYTADGATPPGFPRFTHGWVIGTPAIGDVDGDGRNEVVAATREGRIFVWHTEGTSSESANPWPSNGRDRHNTQNLASGIATTVPEPGAGALGVVALAVLGGLRRVRGRR